MKFLLTAIGTWGDIEPFMAIGQLLRARGEQIVFAFPAQYQHLVPTGIICYPLSEKFLELVEGSDGRIIMGKASWWEKCSSLLRMYKKGLAINRVINRELFDIIEAEVPDRIIYHGKCSYPVLWGMLTKKPTFFVSPVPYLIHEVPGHAHLGFPNHVWRWLQKQSYRIANFGLSKIIKDAQDDLPVTRRFSRKEILKELLDTPLIYTISPTLFQRPGHWPAHALVLGYHERDKQIVWEPPPDLLEFLDHYERVLFVTFGSMINHDPAGVSKMIYNTLAELDIPAIINTAGGGLVHVSEFRDDPRFFVVNHIPYDWILSRVYGMVHHGGSGTTHSGLKYGCATLIIPHIIDQYVWNDLIFHLGVGPHGASINHLNAESLHELVKELWNNPCYREKAVHVSALMKKENFRDELCNVLEETHKKRS